MSDVVFILGAGASVESGTPVMHDFITIARSLYANGETNGHDEAFSTVFREIDALQQVHSKATLDLYNIESIFSVFEMNELIGKEAPVASLIEVIQTTLERTLQVSFPHGKIDPPRWYREFANVALRIDRELKPRRSISVITFNYDIGVDLALSKLGVECDYALPGLPNQPKPFALLKLHGSTHWLRCESCESKPIRALDILQSWEPNSVIGAKYASLDERRGNAKCRSCQSPLPIQSVIVPPALRKTEHQAKLGTVWKRAALELQDATHIIAIGYSLPETDMFFRYLYALGARGGSPLTKFWVINPDERVGERFKGLLGSGARDRFEFSALKFSTAISRIREYFDAGAL